MFLMIVAVPFASLFAFQGHLTSTAEARIEFDLFYLLVMSARVHQIPVKGH